MSGETARHTRSSSIGSSTTQGGFEENEKLTVIDQAKKKSTDTEQGERDASFHAVHGEKSAPAPETKKSSFMMGVIWMVINTLATIGIVCNPKFWLQSLYVYMHHCMPSSADCRDAGFHKQSHFLRSVPEARSADVRSLSLLRDMVDTLHTFSSTIRFFYSSPDNYS